MIALSPGAFYRWMRQAGKLGDQHKVPRVTNDRTTAESLLAVAAGEIGQPGVRPGVLDPAEARP